MYGAVPPFTEVTVNDPSLLAQLALLLVTLNDVMPGLAFTVTLAVVLHPLEEFVAVAV